MTFMVWSEDLVTGIPDVDRQHRGLVDLLNEAAPMLARADDAALQAAGPLLARLVDYAGVHFRTEELLMARKGMAEAAQRHHEAAHAGFAQEVADMIAALRQGRGMSGDRLLSFLASWLVLHILGEDQAMARQLRALEAGTTADEAYLQGRGAELSPDPAALSRALVDIYSVLTRQNRELLLANQALDASRAEVQQQNESLEDVVRQRTTALESLASELRAARDAAEAASRAKSRFLGTVSHELRTPMNAILGYSRLLRDQGLRTPRQDQAGRIVEAAEHLLEMVNGMLEYARLDDDHGQEEAPVTFSVRELLVRLCEPAFAAAKAKGLGARMAVDADMPTLMMGSEKVLGQVLKVFLDNAVKFTAKGGIQVSARILGQDGADRRRVRFTVADTGIGIDVQAMNVLFQPFFQADDSAHRSYEGVGMGLALAQARAQALGGQVGVASEAGQGSRFWLDVVLDVAPDSVTASRASVQPGDVTVPVPVAADNPPGPDAAEPIPEDLRRSLERMAALLAASDTRADDLMRQLQPRLRPCLGSRLDALAGRIAAFDYDQALLLLRGLLNDPVAGAKP